MNDVKRLEHLKLHILHFVDISSTSMEKTRRAETTTIEAHHGNFD